MSKNKARLSASQNKKNASDSINWEKSTGHIAIFNLTRTPHPNLPYQILKEKVVGKRYTLAIIFVGQSRARALNKQYRKKNYTPNVLSFAYSPGEGEIFLCLPKIKEESKKQRRDIQTHTAHLLIHALLHLKGQRHGSKMENEENKILHLFRFVNNQK